MSSGRVACWEQSFRTAHGSDVFPVSRYPLHPVSCGSRKTSQRRSHPSHPRCFDGWKRGRQGSPRPCRNREAPNRPCPGVIRCEHGLFERAFQIFVATKAPLTFLDKFLRSSGSKASEPVSCRGQPPWAVRINGLEAASPPSFFSGRTSTEATVTTTAHGLGTAFSLTPYQ